MLNQSMANKYDHNVFIGWLPFQLKKKHMRSSFNQVSLGGRHFFMAFLALVRVIRVQGLLSKVEVKSFIHAADRPYVKNEVLEMGKGR